ncbi:MAG: winged helix DNA-binding domain-containing protein [Actinobacteria bacterium]|nr:winged helix DNA-binding domain-containing protein [Actinomycetota bacterium]
MAARPRIDAAERRARLVQRHRLAGDASDAVTAVRDVLVLHSSDPATPHLMIRARVAGATTGDLETALTVDRTLWRLHAMRRTMFVVATDDAPAVLAGASSDIAAAARRRMLRWLADAELDVAAQPWLAEVEAEVLDALTDGVLATTDVRACVPRLDTQITLGSGRWKQRTRIASQVLFLLAADGHIVRTAPAGSWRSSQYGWARTEDWFGARPARIDVDEARAVLLGRYLARYGPVTETDARWWTGWTAARTRAALARLGAVAVDLDEGRDGAVLPDDTGATSVPPGGVVSLLPALDATTMGWKQRDWYLSEDLVPALFDRNGNAGPTIWVDGRIVGGWAQRPDGTVVTQLLVDVGAETACAIDAAAGELDTWLGDTTVIPRFRTPLERELATPA